MPLTHNQRQILEAIEAGHTTIRSIAEHTGHSSATVHSNLRRLESGGHLMLRRNGRHTLIEAGQDFARGWDASARLAGNSDALPNLIEWPHRYLGCGHAITRRQRP
jgi:hypothetical protein